MRARLLLLALFVAGLLAAQPAGAATWKSQQPVAPIGVPTAIGEVGDIEFWAPNRGMLITAGNEGSPAGLFAYDGTGWYRYSTVCGGHEGRIAWAGPNEFWTISDQQAGQETGAGPAQHLSLCHFVNGVVVASYAEPLGGANSYLPMDAAACNGPSDCWFAGERLPGTVNVGAFHLHWNGSTLSPVPSLTEAQPELTDPGRSVSSLAFFQGTLYEGVDVEPGDVAPRESPFEPSFLHAIFDSGPTPDFFPIYPEPAVEPAEPAALDGIRLAGNEKSLWAIAGTDVEEEAKEAPLVMRIGPGGFAPVTLNDPGEVLGVGVHILGTAVEPGSGAVWVSYRPEGFLSAPPARLTRIEADGTVAAPTVLPAEGEGVGHKGAAGPIACPAVEQCWMATREGWLFHLGANPPQDNDPVLHTLVTFRPPDPSLPSASPLTLPEDDSGANVEKAANSQAEAIEEPLPKRKPAILSKLHQKLVDGNVLQMTFVLRTRAHVRLLAELHHKVVAKTKLLTLGKGERKLRLRLDPKRWPTKLNLQVHEVGKGGSK
jgi:hypothetical protein